MPLTEAQIAHEREPISYTPVKRLERGPLYVRVHDIPHPIYGYSQYHKEYSVIDLRGYRKGMEPRLEILGVYTPNASDLFRIGTGRLPPYQPTATGDKLQAEMERVGSFHAWRILPETTSPSTTAKEPWQMTLEEYAYGEARRLGEAKPRIDWVKAGYGQHYRDHKASVKYALSKGKPVPPEVLKDYPDLARAVPTKAVTPEVTIPTEPSKGRARILWTRESTQDRIEILRSLSLEKQHFASPWNKLPVEYRDRIATYYGAQGKQPAVIPKAEVTRRAAGPSPSKIESYNTQYSLKQLQEMAKTAGLSPSGLKLDLLNRLIQKGVLK